MWLYTRYCLQQIESRPREGSGSASRGRVSTLSLVDLAGSESAKLNTQGERQLEGSFINKSLLTLGHIIYKLTEEDRPQRRDSTAASRKCTCHMPSDRILTHYYCSLLSLRAVLDSDLILQCVLVLLHAQTLFNYHSVALACEQH